MASFKTAADAVYAAVEIRPACSESKEFQLRFGIQPGDDLFENDDATGNGVNSAYRI